MGIPAAKRAQARLDAASVSGAKVEKQGDTIVVRHDPAQADQIRRVLTADPGPPPELRPVVAAHDPSAPSPDAARKPATGPRVKPGTTLREPTDLRRVDCPPVKRVQPSPSTPREVTPGSHIAPAGVRVVCSTDLPEVLAVGEPALSLVHVTLLDLEPQHDASGRPTTGDGITMHFDAEGRRFLADLTRQLVGKKLPHNRMSLTLGGSSISAPTVNAEITMGQISVTGRSSMKPIHTRLLATMPLKVMPV